MSNDIVIVVDYHSKNMEFRVLNRGTGRERCFNRSTSASTVRQVLEEAERELGDGAGSGGGRLVWIMESTTGWARVKALVAPRAQFLLVNVLQMPLPPKARRRKSDKLDTARVLREYLNGSLPLAHQPEAALRERRRVVSWREDLVKRRTCLRNQVKAHLRHETWDDLTGLWTPASATAQAARAAELAEKMSGDDRLVLEMKIAELQWIDRQIGKAEKRLLELYKQDEAAQRLDEIKGIAEVSAVSIAARIGPIDRFAGADALVAYAGLCPGVFGSDDKSVSLKIGGGGTDKRLRHYLIEASVWARQVPRYRPAYERAEKKHGAKAARVVVARMVLRSIYAMLKHGTRFRAAA